MSDSFNMLFAGDACFSHHNISGSSEAAGMLSALRPVFDKADFRVMNLENPLAEKGVGEAIKKIGPNLLSNPESIAFLEEAGIDLAVLANNHTGDYSDEAIFSTLKILNESKIAYVGAGKDIDEAYKAYRGCINGIRFSIIAICENEFGIADKNKPGAAGFSLSRAKHKIEEEKKASDTVIVSFHGGNEYNPLPSPLAKERYRLLTEFGADAIIAGHTHCAQGYEVYEGKPIVYSMGNFNFMPKKTSPKKNGAWYWGYMVNLEIGKGYCQIKEILPYKFGYEDGVMSLLSGAEKERAEAFLGKVSGMLLNDETVKQYYDSWCMGTGLQYTSMMRTLEESHLCPEGQPAEVQHIKNLFGCEAHNELVKNTLTILCDGRMDEALKTKPALDELIKEECSVIDR